MYIPIFIHIIYISQLANGFWDAFLAQNWGYVTIIHPLNCKAPLMVITTRSLVYRKNAAHISDLLIKGQSSSATTTVNHQSMEMLKVHDVIIIYEWHPTKNSRIIWMTSHYMSPRGPCHMVKYLFLGICSTNPGRLLSPEMLDIAGSLDRPWNRKNPLVGFYPAW